jgi:undecaprenyl pyrophosphate synthase
MLLFTINKMNLLQNIDSTRLPKHLAIIDNGRWAKQDFLRVFRT